MSILKKVDLAGAVRADDAAEFAVVDREIDVAVGHQAAVALGQARCLQDRARKLDAFAMRRPPRRMPARVGVQPAPQPVRRRAGAVLRCAARLAAQQDVQVRDSADDAAAQEADQQHEDDAQHQLPCGAQTERALQEILQEQPHGRADQRTE